MASLRFFPSSSFLLCHRDHHQCHCHHFHHFRLEPLERVHNQSLHNSQMKNHAVVIRKEIVGNSFLR